MGVKGMGPSKPSGVSQDRHRPKQADSGPELG